MPRATSLLPLGALSILALGMVRVLALGADPPPWLSWSSGLGTDEGFYTLDARHLALFGTWARGDFHDRLLSPLLSLAQQGMFCIFGATLVSARAVSAGLGLLTLALLWLGLRVSFGKLAAAAGTLLLGFAPPVVLYNRLALQETPAAFWLTLSFALWALALGRPPIAGRRAGGLLLAAGAAAGAAFLCKTLAIIFLPALCWAAVRSGRRGWAVGAGLGLVLLGWGILWYAPHHAALARMGAYYQRHQFAPHSAFSLWLNIRRAGMGDRAGVLRGLVPYLLLFMPVPCVLAFARVRGAAKTPAEQVLWLWLAGGALFCALSSYAPDRYYLLFLPPLCGLAGIAFAALGPAPRRAFAALALAVNMLWLAAAWHGRTWSVQRNTRTLARLLPARSIVVGDMAPAVCLGTSLDAAPVQPGLSNSTRPLEALGADYLAVTRAPVYTRWWQARYPAIVQPARRVVSLKVGPFRTVDLYKAKP